LKRARSTRSRDRSRARPNCNEPSACPAALFGKREPTSLLTSRNWRAATWLLTFQCTHLRPSVTLVGRMTIGGEGPVRVSSCFRVPAVVTYCAVWLALGCTAANAQGHYETRTERECSPQNVCRQVQHTEQQCHSENVCHQIPQTTQRCTTTQRCQQITRWTQRCQPMRQCNGRQCWTTTSCWNVPYYQQICHPQQACMPHTTYVQQCHQEQRCQPRQVSKQECSSQQQCRDVPKQVWVRDPPAPQPAARAPASPPPAPTSAGPPPQTPQRATGPPAPQPIPQTPGQFGSQPAQRSASNPPPLGPLTNPVSTPPTLPRPQTIPSTTPGQFGSAPAQRNTAASTQPTPQIQPAYNAAHATVNNKQYSPQQQKTNTDCYDTVQNMLKQGAGTSNIHLSNYSPISTADTIKNGPMLAIIKGNVNYSGGTENHFLLATYISGPPGNRTMVVNDPWTGRQMNLQEQGGQWALQNPGNISGSSRPFLRSFRATDIRSVTIQ